MLSRKHRLRKNFQFRYVYRNGKVYKGKYLSVICTSSRQKITKIGLSVSNKIGKATVRNRLKRLLREAVATFLSKIKQPSNIVIVVNVLDVDYKNITLFQAKNELKYLLERAKLIDSLNEDNNEVDTQKLD